MGQAGSVGGVGGVGRNLSLQTPHLLITPSPHLPISPVANAENLPCDIRP
ncbi:hypothetical protein NSTC745_04632 [Nostoc sp. DSM 114161]|jgi:hypothetical protein